MASNTLIEGLDDNQKTGLLQVIIGIFLVTHPVMGMLAYVPTLGIITIAAGIVVIVFAFRVKAGIAIVRTA